MNYIVTTTINSPTKSTIKACSIPNWKLIVAGDLKTPHEEYEKLDCIYLHPEKQEKISEELSNIIGWRSIQRRNFGYIHAFRLGAEKILSLDDDNEMLVEDLDKECIVGQNIRLGSFETDNDVIEPFNIVGGDYTDKWFRGYPPQLVKDRQKQVTNVKGITEKIDIQQCWWYGAADVDGICRLLYGDECNSCCLERFPFTSNKLCLVDSQSTFIVREALKWCPMFTEVGRLDDIFALLYCQSKGFKAGYTRPIFRQDRNPHDIVKDIEGELIGYRHSFDFIRRLTNDPETIWEILPEKTKIMFDRYQKCF